MQLSRRGLIGGLGLLVAAPAVIRVAELMPVKAMPKRSITVFDDVVMETYLRQAMREPLLVSDAVYAELGRHLGLSMLPGSISWGQYEVIPRGMVPYGEAANVL